jgi:hypothetical protein
MEVPTSNGIEASVRLEDSFAEFARAQNIAQTGAPVAAHSPFETSQVEVSGNTVFVRRYGNGPAILMVHGFPRTSLIALRRTSSRHAKNWVSLFCRGTHSAQVQP